MLDEAPGYDRSGATNDRPQRRLPKEKTCDRIHPQPHRAFHLADARLALDRHVARLERLAERHGDGDLAVNLPLHAGQRDAVALKELERRYIPGTDERLHASAGFTEGNGH